MDYFAESFGEPQVSQRRENWNGREEATSAHCSPPRKPGNSGSYNGKNDGPTIKLGYVDPDLLRHLNVTYDDYEIVE